MRNILKLSVLFLFLTFISNTISAQNTKPTIKKGITQKAKPTTKSKFFYVDVRTPAEFAQGSVKGAVNIPLNQIENQLAKFKGKEKIIVFCRSGSRSSQAKAILEQNGFTNVTNGGTWQDVNEILKK